MLDRLTKHPILPQVLIWALLLCHGAFGALHVVAADPVVADPAPAALSAGEHATAHHTSGHDERQTRHAGAAYFAVLLGTFFFGGLVLWVSLRNVPSRAGSFSAVWRSWGMPPEVSSLPRGPTLPLLQVFRL